MSLSRVSFVKSRSRGLWPSVLTTAIVFGLAAGPVGCFIEQEDDGWDHHGGNGGPAPLDTPLEVSIDPGETITAEPGGGVGMFVQYSEDSQGGHWSVSTACDTNAKPSAPPCAFDVWVNVDSRTSITNVKGSGLTGRDVIQMQNGGELYFFAETSSNLDGLTFDTEPGATIELYMLLDGYEEPRLVYWVGDGVLHQGAPSDPVRFVPKPLVTE